MTDILFAQLNKYTDLYTRTHWHWFVIKEDVSVDVHNILVVVSSESVPSSGHRVLYSIIHNTLNYLAII